MSETDESMDTTLESWQCPYLEQVQSEKLEKGELEEDAGGVEEELGKFDIRGSM